MAPQKDMKTSKIFEMVWFSGDHSYVIQRYFTSFLRYSTS